MLIGCLLVKIMLKPCNLKPHDNKSTDVHNRPCPALLIIHLHTVKLHKRMRKQWLEIGVVRKKLHMTKKLFAIF